MDPIIFKVNFASGIPRYLQLMERIKHAKESCVLMPGDQLPAIRLIDQQLVVSPNTVVKAYTELHHEGVIELRHGLGAFVIDQERGLDRGRQIRSAKTAVRKFIETLHGLGFSDPEIRRFVESELTQTPEAASR